MARTRSSYSRERVTVVRRYPWPAMLLNWWTIVMLATGGLLLGVFADFLSIQQQMGLGIPWYVHVIMLKLLYSRSLYHYAR